MDEKITELTTGTPDNSDWMVYVDVSDTTMGPDGTTKKAYKSDLQGAPGTNGTDGTDGVDGTSFTWKGTYSAGTAYVPNDAVEYNGSSYMCKLASTGNAPTNTTYFDLMAQKGADGAGAGDVTANGTLTADRIILGDGTTVIKTSSKSIVTTLGTDDTSVPTSKAVKDVTDAKALLAGSTSQAFSVSQLEVGNASDTTITRVSAGVVAVEGVTIPSISSTNTLTNKRITYRRGSTTSSATPTINTDDVDIYSLTAQTVDITSFTTNLSGTPTHGQSLIIEITGTAARAITWGTSFEASTVALPTTTVSTAMLTVGFKWNSATSKWRCLASA